MLRGLDGRGHKSPMYYLNKKMSSAVYRDSQIFKFQSWNIIHRFFAKWRFIAKQIRFKNLSKIWLLICWPPSFLKVNKNIRATYINTYLDLLGHIHRMCATTNPVSLGQCTSKWRKWPKSFFALPWERIQTHCTIAVLLCSLEAEI